MADAFLQSADLDKRYHNDDDRMTAHYVYNFMQAWEDYHSERPNPINESKACTNGKWMPSAKIFVNWNTSESGDIQNYLITNQSKGGVLKIFDSKDVSPVTLDSWRTLQMEQLWLVISFSRTQNLLKILIKLIDFGGSGDFVFVKLME